MYDFVNVELRLHQSIKTMSPEVETALTHKLDYFSTLLKKHI